MKTKNQIFLIKIAYLFILILSIVINFGDFQRGFMEGFDETKSKNIGFLEGVFILFSTTIALNIIIQLYLFINSIHLDLVFSEKNIKRLDKMGWCCIILSFTIYAFYISKIGWKDLSYSVIAAVNFEFWLLIFGITLLTIGFVFKKGIELQQEQDLTI